MTDVQIASQPEISTQPVADAPVAPETQTANAVDENAQKFAENFARLARKERMMRERETQYKTWEQSHQRVGELESLAKADPIAFLGKFGLSYDDITRRLIADPKSPEQQKLETLEEKISKWESDRAKEEETVKQRQQEEAYQRTIGEISKLVDSNPDKWELVRINEAYDLVLQTMGEYHNKEGRWVDYETAADWTEEHLEKELEKFSTSKKLASKFAPKPEETPASAQNTATVAKAVEAMTPRTLTNQSASVTAPPNTGRVSEQELRERALAVLRNAQA